MKARSVCIECWLSCVNMTSISVVCMPSACLLLHWLVACGLLHAFSLDALTSACHHHVCFCTACCFFSYSPVTTCHNLQNGNAHFKLLYFVTFAWVASACLDFSAPGAGACPVGAHWNLVFSSGSTFGHAKSWCYDDLFVLWLLSSRRSFCWGHICMCKCEH